MFIGVFVAFSMTRPWACQMVIGVNILLILDIEMRPKAHFLAPHIWGLKGHVKVPRWD
jgi:hypothetical protein